MGHDLVIPLSDTSVNHDIELKYALRSIERHAGNVFIIGRLPKWVRNTTHISFDDIPNLRFKEQNIYNKLAEACNDPRVSDPFIYANDDHFLLPGYDPAIYWHKGKLTPNVNGPYNSTIKNTIALLGEVNNFDTHCPMLIHKQRFLDSMPQVWSDWGYCMKTLYCHANGIEGQQAEDLKINQPHTAKELHSKVEGRTWFSVGDIFFSGQGIKFLNQLYPNKSKYE